MCNYVILQSHKMRLTLRVTRSVKSERAKQGTEHHRGKAERRFPRRKTKKITGSTLVNGSIRACLPERNPYRFHEESEEQCLSDSVSSRPVW